MNGHNLLAALRASLEAELREPHAHRSSQASGDSLTWAIEKVREAEHHMERDDGEAALRCVDEISRRAIDGWSLTSPLTEAAAECAQRLRSPGR